MDYCKRHQPEQGCSRLAFEVPPAPTLRLVEPGKEPRKPLRYRFERGARRSGTRTSGSLTAATDARLRCVGDDGSGLFEMQAAMGEIRRTTPSTFVKVTARGITSQAYRDVQGQVDPKAQQEPFEPVTLVLPEQPLGIGGVWETVDRNDPQVE